MSHPGRSTGSSGRTGRARRRCSAFCLVSPLRTAAALRSWARRSGAGGAVPDGVTGFVDGPGLYPALTAGGTSPRWLALRGPGAPTAGIDDILEAGRAHRRRRRQGARLLPRNAPAARLAAALLTKPRLLVLDEPANGLDPAGKRHVHGPPRPAPADGATVILSSHRMDDLEELCSEVTIVATGRDFSQARWTSWPGRTGTRLPADDLRQRRRRDRSPRKRTGSRWSTTPAPSRTAGVSWCARRSRPRRAGAASRSGEHRGARARAASSRRLRPRSSLSPSDRNPRRRRSPPVTATSRSDRAAPAARPVPVARAFRFELVKLLAQWRVRC